MLAVLTCHAFSKKRVGQQNCVQTGCSCIGYTSKNFILLFIFHYNSFFLASSLDGMNNIHDTKATYLLYLSLVKRRECVEPDILYYIGSQASVTQNGHDPVFHCCDVKESIDPEKQCKHCTTAWQAGSWSKTYLVLMFSKDFL